MQAQPTQPDAENARAPSILPAEVAKFAALAARWWDPSGPMRPLHAMNPVRVGWIDARLRECGLSGTRLLDVGCGAGIAAEALADAGYTVMGIDAAAEPVAVAAAHGADRPTLTYRVTSAESLLATGERFGAVAALEVIEHVADPQGFVITLAALLRPGGVLILSTLNRTALAYATAKIGAEYVLRLLPVGTHDWRRFVTPAELAGYCRAASLRVNDLTGLRPTLAGHWTTSAELSVNYMLCAVAEQ